MPGLHIQPDKRYGFFPDTTLCLGRKPCEVACKEWNLLPAGNVALSGMSCDNTRALGAATWASLLVRAELQQAPSMRWKRPTPPSRPRPPT